MISTKGRYALRLMLDLAMQDKDSYISLKSISQRQKISLKYLEQIVGSLCKVGYIKSSRGAKGGYSLGKSSKEYTVGDILRVTEGSLAPVACLSLEENTCSRACDCLALDFWQGLYGVIENYVDNITLADIIAKGQNKVSDFYII